MKCVTSKTPETNYVIYFQRLIQSRQNINLLSKGETIYCIGMHKRNKWSKQLRMGGSLGYFRIMVLFRQNVFKVDTSVTQYQRSF